MRELLKNATIRFKKVTGDNLAQGETVETIATVFQITRDHIVAMCRKGIFYYLAWSGKEPAYKQLEPGALVRVYHTPGFNPTVYTLEVIFDDSGGAQEP